MSKITTSIKFLLYFASMGLGLNFLGKELSKFDDYSLENILIGFILAATYFVLMIKELEKINFTEMENQ